MSKPHVVMFPFPALGHINPMGLLATHLASSGDLDITLIYTATTMSLFDNSTNNLTRATLSQGIKIEVIQDRLDPMDKSAPSSPSLEMLVDSYPLLMVKLEELLHKLCNVCETKEGAASHALPPCCIISNSFLNWTQDVANKFNIPRIEFWPSSVTAYAMGSYVPRLLANGQLPVKPGASGDTSLDPLPGLGSWKICDFFYDLAYPISPFIFKFIHESCARGKEAQRVIVHSVYEWEKEIVNALRHEGIPIDPIGPLLLKGYKRATPHSEDDGCLEWLDKQANSSVIYVAFGSYAKLSLEEIHELALGLEDSQQPFLLVIRPDLALGKDISSVLPTGFLLRTKERGRVSSWAPQLDVLAHDAIGGFITHCGWNSTLESLWNGKPFIGCPRGAEQNTNLKCLIDWNVAIPMDAGKHKVELKKGLVTKAIHTLMHTREGEKVRERVSEMKEEARRAMEIGYSRSSLNKLVEDIKEMSLGARPCFL